MASSSLELAILALGVLTRHHQKTDPYQPTNHHQPMPRSSATDRLRRRLISRGRRPAVIHRDPSLNRAGRVIIDWYGRHGGDLATSYQVTMWMVTVLRVIGTYHWELVPGYRIIRTWEGEAWHYHCWFRVDGEVVDIGSLYDQEYGSLLAEGCRGYRLSIDSAVESRYPRFWIEGEADRDDHNAAVLAAQSLRTNIDLFCISEPQGSGDYAGLKKALQHIFSEAPYSRSLMSEYQIAEPADKTMELQ